MDAVIVGGGMCGMLVWFALQSAGMRNVRIVDCNPAGFEGPWETYARMETLRSPKHLTGPAYGMGSLTFRAWFEAQYGEAAWEELDKIPTHHVDGLSPLVQESPECTGRERCRGVPGTSGSGFFAPRTRW